MDRDTDLFVQAFWVKCRDVIRPELDLVTDDLKHAGHDAHIATQEYSPVADGLPLTGPALTLTVHPKGPEGTQRLQFHGDVPRRTVVIIGSGREVLGHELAELDDALVKREIADWLAVALNHHP